VLLFALVATGTHRWTYDKWPIHRDPPFGKDQLGRSANRQETGTSSGVGRTAGKAARAVSPRDRRARCAPGDERRLSVAFNRPCRWHARRGGRR